MSNRVVFYANVEEIRGIISDNYAAILETYSDAQLNEEEDILQASRTEIIEFLLDLDRMMANSEFGALYQEEDRKDLAETADSKSLTHLEGRVNEALNQLNPAAFTRMAKNIEERVSKLGRYNARLQDLGGAVHRFDIVDVDRNSPLETLVVDMPHPPAKRRRVDRPVVGEPEVSTGKQVMYALGLVFVVWAIGEVGSS